jgi:hypothetical protein
MAPKAITIFQLVAAAGIVLAVSLFFVPDRAPAKQGLSGAEWDRYWEQRMARGEGFHRADVERARVARGMMSEFHMVMKGIDTDFPAEACLDWKDAPAQIDKPAQTRRGVLWSEGDRLFLRFFEPGRDEKDRDISLKIWSDNGTVAISNGIQGHSFTISSVGTIRVGDKEFSDEQFMEIVFSDQRVYLTQNNILRFRFPFEKCVPL